MFITLKCNKDKVSVEQASASTAQGTRPRHAACTQCRTKKLKCSGNRERCSNCTSNDLECIYPPPSTPSRGNSGSTKRSRAFFHATSPPTATQTSTPSPSSRTPDPPTPRLPRSDSRTSIKPGIHSFPWSADPALPSDDTGGYLESFWTESPASLEDGFEANAEIFPPDFGGNTFKSHIDLSSGDSILQTNVNDALAALSSEILRDQSIGLTPSYPINHQAGLSSTMLLPPLGEADTMPFADFTSIVSTDDTDGSCRCMTDALVTLDRIEAQKSDDGSSCLTNTISSMLSTNKSALSQCTRVLECSSCQFRPGCALLLILICRNLVSQFQQLLFGDLDQGSHASEISPGSSINSDGTAALGQYSIDTWEEQLQVLHALSIVRGRSLALFLERLKAFVGLQGRASHREKVERIESWHRASMERLKQMSYERI